MTDRNLTHDDLTSYKIIDMMSNPETANVQRYNVTYKKYNDDNAHDCYGQYNYESSPVESTTWFCNKKNKAVLFNVCHFTKEF